MNVVLVGRHSGEIPGVNIVEQVNKVWSTDFDECRSQFLDFLGLVEPNRGVLLQNTPGILATVLFDLAVANQGHLPRKVGVIISKVGQREAGVTFSADFGYVSDGRMMKDLAKWMNPNVKVEWDMSAKIIHFTVDPPMKFEFDQIQWLN